MNPVKAVVYTYFMYKHVHIGLNDFNSLSTEFLECNLQKMTINRESPAQFENRIKTLVYVSRITHSTMYE